MLANDPTAPVSPGEDLRKTTLQTECLARCPDNNLQQTACKYYIARSLKTFGGVCFHDRFEKYCDLMTDTSGKPINRGD